VRLRRKSPRGKSRKRSRKVRSLSRKVKSLRGKPNNIEIRSIGKKKDRRRRLKKRGGKPRKGRLPRERSLRKRISSSSSKGRYLKTTSWRIRHNRRR